MRATALRRKKKEISQIVSLRPIKNVEVKADPFYSESNINHLEKVISRIESGKSVLKEHKIPGVDE